MADIQKHLDVTTRTSEDQAWDQVVAMSQSMINDGLKSLYERSKDLQGFYSMKTDSGTMEAEFDAPEVIIPGADKSAMRNNVIFRLKFKSGKLTSAKGKAIIPNMKDWILAYKVDWEVAGSSLEKLKKDIKRNQELLATETDEEEKELITDRISYYQEELDRVKSTYAVPGDYSVQRLFLKLSSIEWSTLDKEGEWGQAGINPKTGKPKELRDWKADNARPGRDNPADALTTWLEQWSKVVTKKGQTVFATNFQIPPIPNSDYATLRPTFLSHQAYGYKSEAFNCKDGYTGPTGNGTRNALLFCEMVDDHEPPNEHFVTWSGNFVTHPGSNTSNDQIDGCFVLGRKVFLEDFVLKQFQNLTQSTQVLHNRPTATKNPQNYTNFTSSVTYTIGWDPEHNTRGDKFFKFKPTNPQFETGKETKYVWDRTYEWPQLGAPPGDLEHIHGGGKSNLKQTLKSEMHTEVTWVPGKPSLTISGMTTITEDELWDQGYGAPNFAEEHLTAYSRNTYIVRWKLVVNIALGKDKKGHDILTVTFDAGTHNDGGISIEPKREQRKELLPGGRAETVRQRLTENMTGVIKDVIKNITEAVERAGRFTYPAEGTLVFKDPMFNRFGDFMCTIGYAPLKPGEKISIPTPFEGVNTPDPTMVITTTKPLVPPGKIPLKLTWDVKPVDLTDRKPGQVVLRAENKSGHELYFGQFSVAFDSHPNEKLLFGANEFIKKGSDVPVVPETPAGGPAEKEKHEKESNAKKEGATTGAPAPADKAGHTAPPHEDFVHVDKPAAVAATGSAGHPEPAHSPPEASKETQTAPAPPSKTPPATKDSSHDSTFGWVKDKLTGKKGKPTEKPTIPKIRGTISLKQSPNGTPMVLDIRNPEPDVDPKKAEKPPAINWQAVLSPPTEEGSKLQPPMVLKNGDWFEIVIEGPAGLLGQYDVMIDEVYALKDGEIDGHRLEPRAVSVGN